MLTETFLLCCRWILFQLKKYSNLNDLHIFPYMIEPIPWSVFYPAKTFCWEDVRTPFSKLLKSFSIMHFRLLTTLLCQKDLGILTTRYALKFMDVMGVMAPLEFSNRSTAHALRTTLWERCRQWAFEVLKIAQFFTYSLLCMFSILWSKPRYIPDRISWTKMQLRSWPLFSK